MWFITFAGVAIVIWALSAVFQWVAEKVIPHMPESWLKVLADEPESEDFWND